MTTASKAIYDYAVIPPKLIGVVGVDLLTRDIDQVDTNYTGLLQALAKRCAKCAEFDRTTRYARQQPEKTAATVSRQQQQ